MGVADGGGPPQQSCSSSDALTPVAVECVWSEERSPVVQSQLWEESPVLNPGPARRQMASAWSLRLVPEENEIS